MWVCVCVGCGCVWVVCVETCEMEHYALRYDDQWGAWCAGKYRLFALRLATHTRCTVCAVGSLLRVKPYVTHTNKQALK